MNSSLQALITEATQVLEPATCERHGHVWASEGGRPCPRGGGGNCSQTFYVCSRCGKEDYGDKGGPGHADCYVDGPCDASCIDEEET
jgi:hypothetical protein